MRQRMQFLVNPPCPEDQCDAMCVCTRRRVGQERTVTAGRDVGERPPARACPHPVSSTQLHLNCVYYGAGMYTNTAQSVSRAASQAVQDEVRGSAQQLAQWKPLCEHASASCFIIELTVAEPHHMRDIETW